MKLFETIETLGHEQVVTCYDKASGYRGIIAIHDTTLGPALGGTRFWNYASDDEAFFDVLRLSRGMTYKNAVAGLNLGGGKAVIIGDPTAANRELIFRAHGRFVESLSGRYVTAEDVNTSPADMDYVHMETDYVAGLATKSGDPSPVTARGGNLYGMFQFKKYGSGPVKCATLPDGTEVVTLSRFPIGSYKPLTPGIAKPLSEVEEAYAALVVATRDYVKKNGIPKSIEDLDKHKILTFGQAPPYLTTVNWLETIGRSEGDPRPVTLRVNNAYGLRRAVQSGIGLASIADYIVAADAGRIQRRKLDLLAAQGVVELRHMDEPLDALVEFDERAEVGHPRDLALDEPTDVVAREEVVPDVGRELLEPERQALVLGVDAEHHRLDHVALLQHFRRVLDPLAPRHVGDVDQAVALAAEGHERPEVRGADHAPGVVLADLDLTHGVVDQLERALEVAHVIGVGLGRLLVDCIAGLAQHACEERRRHRGVRRHEAERRVRLQQIDAGLEALRHPEVVGVEEGGAARDGVGPGRAQLAHRFGDRSEQFRAIAALFHHLVPPGLAIAMARGLGQPMQRVEALERRVGRRFGSRRSLGANCLRVRRRRVSVHVALRIILIVRGREPFLRRACFGFGALLLFDRESMRERQIDEAHRHAVLDGPAHRLPFGRKLGERVIDREAGRVGAITEQRHRRLQALRHEADQRVAFGRAFDQHAIGL